MLCKLERTTKSIIIIIFYYYYYLHSHHPLQISSLLQSSIIIINNNSENILHKQHTLRVLNTLSIHLVHCASHSSWHLTLEK